MSRFFFFDVSYLHDLISVILFTAIVKTIMQSPHSKMAVDSKHTAAARRGFACYSMAPISPGLQLQQVVLMLFNKDFTHRLHAIYMFFQIKI